MLPGGRDPDMKMSIALPVETPAAAGESVASKGEVNADNQRIKTPAERLSLFDENSADKHEKCLAEAVYFEFARRGGARTDRGRAGRA